MFITKSLTNPAPNPTFHITFQRNKNSRNITGTYECPKLEKAKPRVTRSTLHRCYLQVTNLGTQLSHVLYTTYVYTHLQELVYHSTCTLLTFFSRSSHTKTESLSPYIYVYYINRMVIAECTYIYTYHGCHDLPSKR